MKEIFSDIPTIIENNFSIAIKCNYFPREIPPNLPKFSRDLNISESNLINQLSKISSPSDFFRFLLIFCQICKF